MFRFKAVGTVFKALKTEHLIAPSPNLHIRSHTVGAVCLNVCRCVNLLLHVNTTLSNFVDLSSLSKLPPSEIKKNKYYAKVLLWVWAVWATKTVKGDSQNLAGLVLQCENRQKARTWRLIAIN